MKKIVIAFIFLFAFILLLNYYFYQFSSGLNNSKWVVDKIEGIDLVDNTAISLDFVGNNKISGNSGVNIYSCVYNLRNTLTFNKCESTEMASTNPLINEIETKYLALLLKVKYYKIDDNILRLLDNESKILMTLKRKGE